MSIDQKEQTEIPYSTGNTPDGTLTRKEVQDGEENPPTYESPTQQDPPDNKKKAMSSATKKKVVGFIVGPLVGMLVALGIGSAGGVGLVNFKEVISNKYGARIEAVFSKRLDHAWAKKINSSEKTPAIKGLCAKKIAVACRYSGMSDREISKMEKRSHGRVKVNAEASKNILGKRIVNSIEIDGKTLTAREYAIALRGGDPSVRSAMRDVMRPRFAVWTGAKIKSLMTHLGITKARGISAETDPAKLKERLAQNIAGDVDIDPNARKTFVEGETKESQQTVDETNKVADKLTDGKLTSNSIGDRIRTNVFKNLGEDSIKNVTRTATSVGKSLLITGYMDNACTVLNIISATGYLAKSAGKIQLIRFAMSYMNHADAIKAGEATVESIDFMGEILANTTSDDDRTAFDSFGYQLAAYGHVGDPDDTLEFRLGGGIAGSMIGFVETIKQATGGRSTCNIIQNPAFRVGSAVVGIAAAILSGGSIPAGQIAGSVSLSVGLQLIQAFSMPLIADIIAGEFVNDTTVGNSAGNAIFSGADALYAENANTSGMFPLTKSEVVALDTSTTASYIATNKQLDNSGFGVFDASNPNTLVGGLFARLAPTITSPSVAVGTTRFLSFINPLSSKPANASVDEYDICSDLDYKDLGLATSPFCNPVYGMTDDILNLDPEAVIVKMLESQNIDDNGAPKPGSQYEEFTKLCAENASPWGIDINEETATNIKTADCLPSTNKYPKEFWAYRLDSVIHDASSCLMEDEESACGSSESSSGASPSTSSNTSTPAGPSSPVTASGFAWPAGEADYKKDRGDYLEAHAISGGHFYGNTITGAATDFSISYGGGEPIYAMSGGIVDIAPLPASGKPDNGGLSIKSSVGGHELIVLYAHGKNVKYKKGDSVQTGAHIMDIGNVGQSFGNHVHLQIFLDGVAKCPQDLLLAMEKGGTFDLNALPKATPGCPGRY